MFGDRTKGSLLHDGKIVQTNSQRPQKEVYHDNLATSLSHSLREQRYEELAKKRQNLDK